MRKMKLLSFMQHKLFRLLLEMNHEVRGEARQESVDQVKPLEMCICLKI